MLPKMVKFLDTILNKISWFCVNSLLSINGYLKVSVSKPKRDMVLVHRLVYETFVSEIQNGYQIDHINTVRDDNRVENLRCVTPKENANNPLTLKHISEAQKGKTISVETRKKMSEAQKGNCSAKGKPRSEFGTKFKEHFGITFYENTELYHREQMWYYRHNHKCSWEMNTDERN